MKSKMILTLVPVIFVFGAITGCRTNISVESIKATCDSTFKVGDQIDKSNIKVTATYSNKSSKEVSNWTCDAFKDDKYQFVKGDVGEKQFVIKYESKETTLKVTVNDIIGEFVVKFDTNGGTTIPDIIVKEGEKISKPTDPVKKGYLFKKWCNGSEEYNFDLPVTSNLTLTANYEVITYTITYHNIEGATHSNPESYTIETDKITLGNAKKDNFKFHGWYSNKELSKKVNTIEKGSTGNLDLYAAWETLATKVTITTTKTTIVEDDENVLLTATVEPAEAYQGVVWFCSSGASQGSGKIIKDESNNYYLNGTSEGTVIVTAIAEDSSAKSDTKTFTISPKTFNVDSSSLISELTKKSVVVTEGSVSKTVTKKTNVSFKYKSESQQTVTIKILSNKVLIDSKTLTFDQASEEKDYSFNFSNWDRAKSDDTITFEVVLPDKENFIYNFNQYAKVYEASSKEYTIEQIPTVKYKALGTTLGEFSTTAIETEGSGTSKQTKVVFLDSSTEKKLRIDCHNISSNTLNNLKESTEADVSYEFTDDYILYEYTKANMNETKKLKINKYGYVLCYELGNGSITEINPSTPPENKKL